MDKQSKDECLIAADRVAECGFLFAANELRRLATGPSYWYLEPRTEWQPWYDKVFGMVVIAATEENARLVAASNHGDEGPYVWLDDKVTRCLEMSPEGKDRLIIRDHARA